MGLIKLLSVDETAVEALVSHPGPSIADYDVHGMILKTFSGFEKIVSVISLS